MGEPRKPGDIKRVSARLVIGPHGRPVIARGYTEIHGLRIYEDRLIIGPRGGPMLDIGTVEVVQP